MANLWEFSTHIHELFITFTALRCSLHSHYHALSSSSKVRPPQYVTLILEFIMSCARTKFQVFLFFDAVHFIPLITHVSLFVFITLVIYIEEGHICRPSILSLTHTYFLFYYYFFCSPFHHFLLVRIYSAHYWFLSYILEIIRGLFWVWTRLLEALGLCLFRMCFLRALKLFWPTWLGWGHILILTIILLS